MKKTVPEAPEYTPYPYINEVLGMFLENLRTVLGEYFVGLYLHGSLAGGGFDPGHSDIDFLVVTSCELPKTMIPKLKAMHEHIWQNGPEWSKKLEGTYIPKKSLYKYNASDPPRPHVNAEKFMFFSNEPYWVIERHILRERGVVVAGPALLPMIAPVSPQELRSAIINGIIEGWTPRVNDGEWLTNPGYQPYIVLTCCRILYTLKYGTLKSKNTCARWAEKALGQKWRGLINQALVWSYGMPNGDITQTLEMMKYTLARVKKYQIRLSGNL